MHRRSKTLAVSFDQLWRWGRPAAFPRGHSGALPMMGDVSSKVLFAKSDGAEVLGPTRIRELQALSPHRVVGNIERTISQ